MSDLSDCDHSFMLLRTEQGYRMRCTKCGAEYLVDSFAEAVVRTAEEREQYKALLRRWVGGEHQWETRVVGMGRTLYACPFCGSQTRGQDVTWRDILHAPGCLVGDTLRALGEGQ